MSRSDRKRAGKLAEDSPLDMFMVRYNAAHTGAEQDIFPHLAKRKPALVAYTATRWRGLLKRPKDWSGPVMTASEVFDADDPRNHQGENAERFTLSPFQLLS